MSDQAPKTMMDCKPLKGSRRLSNGERFSWGVVIQEIKVSDFWIVEYAQDLSNTGGCADYSKHGSHLFSVETINGKRRSHSYLSLDEALIGAIAAKYDGYGSHAEHFIQRMIGNVVHPHFASEPTP